MNRPTHATEYLRHNLSDKELLALGDELVAAQTQLIELKEEKAAVTAQIADKQKGAEQSIGRLTRLMGAKFEMRNVRCILKWDTPNLNEVSYIREDNGEVVKVRPFSESERQSELPLTDREGEIKVIPPAQAEAAIEESQQNVDGFFHQEMCENCEKAFPPTALTEVEGRKLCSGCKPAQASEVEIEGVGEDEEEATEAVTSEDEPQELNF